MQVIWTTEQVLGLAPDDNLQKSSRVLAVPEKWSDLGATGNLAWGTYVIKGRSEFHVVADLQHLSFSCSCKNRKFPCNHALALALMMVEQWAQIPVGDKPLWVSEFEQAVSAHQDNQHETDQATRQKHERQLRNGLAEFELWLRDLARTGIANLPSINNDDWEARAGRLVDTRAPALAAEVREWKQIVASDKRWPERVLRRIGRIYLLIQAFENIDNLPFATQSDLYRAVGWGAVFSAEDQLVDDRWLVIGSKKQQRGNRLTQRSYLIGEQSGKAVQIVQRHGGTRQQRRAFVTGTVLTATVRIFASQTPLDAAIASITTIDQLDNVNLYQYHNDYATNLEKNPFIEPQPMIVAPSVLWNEQNAWFIGDSHKAMRLETLPVGVKRSPVRGARQPVTAHQASGQSPYLWHLKALEGAPCFGLWDDTQFSPLSVWVDNRLLDLNLLRGIK